MQCLTVCLHLQRHSNQFRCFTFYSLLVRSDRCTLDTDVVLANSFGRVDCNLVVSLVSVWQAKIIVFAVNIQIGEDQLINKLKKINNYF